MDTSRGNNARNSTSSFTTSTISNTNLPPSNFKKDDDYVPIGGTPYNNDNDNSGSFVQNAVGAFTQKAVESEVQKQIEQSLDNNNQNDDDSMFSLKRFRFLADIDTDEFLDRLFGSFKPLNNEWNKKVQEKPDFYGPFWLTITFFFLTLICTNGARYLKINVLKTEPGIFIFRFGDITPFALSLLGHLFIMPLFMFIAGKIWLIQTPTYFHCICIVGYSLSIFLISYPVSLILPSVLALILLFIAATFAGQFVGYQLWLVINKEDYLIPVVFGILEIFFNAYNCYKHLN
eukprot:TRINITY_DN10583_c0_g1_i1.p1 TRINITY_DN10583_c0_g1~~TRINITY_DN10583_c0_g1_i1.p1  ORF type:complete len:312 (+),score=82.32 TRINITY_DN10583_c0_g1_i1:71-937(+)